MSFLGSPPNQARKPFAEILPDGRKRLTRWFRTTTSGEIPAELDYAVNSADKWTDAPTGWTGLRLTYKQLDDDARGFPQAGADHQPLVRLIYEEISQTSLTRVGANVFTQLPDGRDQVVQEWVMFSTSTYTPETPGSSTAVGLATYYLWQEEAPNDGTLRKVIRTYQTAGTVRTNDESLNGGKLLKKTIESFKDVPATPTGYTLVGTPVQNPNGYPIYTYTFYSAASGAGAGGVISTRYVNAMGGSVAFNPASPNSATGEVRCIITYLSPASQTTDPTTGPTSFVRVGAEIEDKDGFRVWTVTYGFGGGSNVLTDLRGEADGSLVYTYVSKTLAADTPAYGGTGTAPLVKLENVRGEGFFTNTAVYRKIPASVGFRKMVKFVMPGLAAISGAPVKYTLSPPVTMEILATVTVDYSTSQVTTTPFTVSAYATLNTQWIPYTKPGASPTPGSPPSNTTTGPPRSTTESLGGYLASSSGTSGSNAFFNGVFVLTYEQTLGSSTPSTRPSGSTTIAVDNDPYLVDTSGVVYFRRTVTTYTF